MPNHVRSSMWETTIPGTQNMPQYRLPDSQSLTQRSQRKQPSSCIVSLTVPTGLQEHRLHPPAGGMTKKRRHRSTLSVTCGRQRPFSSLGQARP